MHEEHRPTTEKTMKARARTPEDDASQSFVNQANDYIHRQPEDRLQTRHDFRPFHHSYDPPSYQAPAYMIPHTYLPHSPCAYPEHLQYIHPYGYSHGYGLQHPGYHQPVPQSGMYPYYSGGGLNYHQPSPYPVARVPIPRTISPPARKASPAPKAASPDPFAPLPDSTLPWYGRTRKEVASDMVKQHHVKPPRTLIPDDTQAPVRATIRSSSTTPNAKSETRAEKKASAEQARFKQIQPVGGDNDPYWVVHCDGDTKLYSRATIEFNFDGYWKVDAEGYPYFKEVGGTSKSNEW